MSIRMSRAALQMKRQVLWAVAGVSAFGCGADAWDGTRETDVPAADGTSKDDQVPTATGQTQQALGDVTAQFTWVQGQPWVKIGSLSNDFCYLTEIQGRFEGSGEVVGIFETTDGWSLGGFSGQHGVGGRARCTPRNFAGRTLSVTPEFTWSQGQAKTRMATDDGFTACVLTRVTGRFHGDGEAVEITRSNGAWFLGGKSQQSGVAARARCIKNVFVGGGTPTFQSFCDEDTIACDIPGCTLHGDCFGGPRTDLGPLVAPPAIWGPGVFTACGLGKMSGNFKGDGEQVMVTLSNGEWLLDAVGHQEGTFSTSAYCFL